MKWISRRDEKFLQFIIFNLCLSRPPWGLILTDRLLLSSNAGFHVRFVALLLFLVMSLLCCLAPNFSKKCNNQMNALSKDLESVEF